MTTPSEHFTEREERGHEMAERIEREHRHGELFERACQVYPKLIGADEKIEELAQFLIANEIDEAEKRLARLREQKAQLDTPEFTYSEALTDFAARFQAWVDAGCPGEETQ